MLFNNDNDYNLLNKKYVVLAKSSSNVINCTRMNFWCIWLRKSIKREFMRCRKAQGL